MVKGFCYTSTGTNETLGTAQIGKSILRYSSKLKHDGNSTWKDYNITDINDWEFDDILDRCDAQVYEFCNHTQTLFQEACWEGDFGNSDICFSEGNLRSDNN